MLTRFYNRNILLTCVFTFICFMVYFIIYSNYTTYQGKAGWPTPQFYFPFEMAFLLINASVIAIMSFPLFLNKYPAIRDNAIWSAASWMSLPFILVVLEIAWHRSGAPDYSQGLDSPGIIDALIMLSCFAGLLLPYLQFRKKVRENTLSHSLK